MAPELSQGEEDRMGDAFDIFVHGSFLDLPESAPKQCKETIGVLYGLLCTLHWMIDGRAPGAHPCSNCGNPVLPLSLCKWVETGCCCSVPDISEASQRSGVDNYMEQAEIRKKDLSLWLACLFPNLSRYNSPPRC